MPDNDWLTQVAIRELGEGLYPPGNTHGLSDPFLASEDDPHTPHLPVQTEKARTLSMIRQGKRESENYASPSPEGRRREVSTANTASPYSPSPMDFASPSGRIQIQSRNQAVPGSSRPVPMGALLPPATATTHGDGQARSRHPSSSGSSRLPVPIRSQPWVSSNSPEVSATGYVLSNYQDSSGLKLLRIEVAFFTNNL